MKETLRLGPYEAREFVVRHSHGSVCRVTDAAGAGSMTAKLYAPTGSPTPAQLDRWQDEFAVEVDALQAHASDLVPIRDCGRAGEMAWVVTDAPRGRFLSELTDSDALTAEQAIGIVGNIAAALDRLHRSDLVHRSLKPSNIVIDPDGAVRFMDATLLGRVAEAILAGSLPLDRVACVAPESVLGYRQRSSSNVYALSVIAYRALGGAWPHDQTSAVDYAYACVYNDHVPLAARDATWGSEAEEVFARGLAKDPEQRFASCSEFADALAHAGSLRAEEAAAPTASTAALPSPDVRLGPRLVEDPVEEAAESAPEGGPDQPDPEPAAGDRALPVLEIDAVDLEEVETLIPDLEALPSPQLVDLDADGSASTPEAMETSSSGPDGEVAFEELNLDEASPIPGSGRVEQRDAESPSPAYASVVRGPGTMERMRTLLADALARFSARVAGSSGTGSDHRMREDYLADWRARMPSAEAVAAPLEDPVVPEWTFRVEPAAPAWLRIDGRYAGPVPAEVTIRGRAGADVRIEVMRDGACIAQREVQLHPLMDKVWDLRDE